MKGRNEQGRTPLAGGGGYAPICGEQFDHTNHSPQNRTTPSDTELPLLHIYLKEIIKNVYKDLLQRN